jgi:cytochrome c-type biogenesis protein CcmE
MSNQTRTSETSKYLKFGSVTVLDSCARLAILPTRACEDSKSYYVTIKELNGMGNDAYSKRLRVAGNVVPGSIKRSGTRVDFMLKENDLTLPVSYTGTEAPPDTFKDDSQALADGSFGRDRRIPRQATAGQVRLEVRPTTRSAGSYAGRPSRARACPRTRVRRVRTPHLAGWQIRFPFLLL